jgi:hypothetical protein
MTRRAKSSIVCKSRSKMTEASGSVASASSCCDRLTKAVRKSSLRSSSSSSTSSCPTPTFSSSTILSLICIPGRALAFPEQHTSHLFWPTVGFGIRVQHRPLGFNFCNFCHWLGQRRFHPLWRWLHQCLIILCSRNAILVALAFALK